MIIYSDVALTFLKEVRAFSLKILKYEMNLPFERKRLLHNGFYYPLDFVIFEHPTILGQYIPSKYQIQINKHLIYQTNKTNLQNIIRHEICHYIAHVTFGANIQAHGKEFNEVCQRFGYGKEVSSSTIELSRDDLTCEENKVFEKITKLFKLATSDNQHEAQLATTKANQLLRKHHLRNIPTLHPEDETVLEVALSGKKVGPKHEAIYRILKEFLVSPVFNYQRGSFSLEVIGERTNVLTAVYVAEFLTQKLERLYDQQKMVSPSLRGIRAKKSFMAGLADGYLSKIKTSYNDQFTKADLVKCESQVQKHLQRVYPRLRGRLSTIDGHDISANALGKEAGKKLNINPAISNKSRPPLLLE